LERPKATQKAAFRSDLKSILLIKSLVVACKSLNLTTLNYQLLIGDAYDLEFPDGVFDLVMNNYLFDLLPKKDFIPVLKQFKRVLKPAGRIILVNMTKGEHFYQRFLGKRLSHQSRLAGRMPRRLIGSGNSNCRLCQYPP